jgi:hypothetical protein
VTLFDGGLALCTGALLRRLEHRLLGGKRSLGCVGRTECVFSGFALCVQITQLALVLRKQLSQGGHSLCKVLSIAPRASFSVHKASITLPLERGFSECLPALASRGRGLLSGSVSGSSQRCDVFFSVVPRVCQLLTQRLQSSSC